MQSDLYQSVFDKLNIDVSVPPEDDQNLIKERLFDEIEKGIIKYSTRRELLDIAQSMRDSRGIDAVILGCTELPLILDQAEYLGLPMLNTAAIHVDAIVEYCRQEGSTE